MAPQQLGLFGADPRAAGVGPAPVDAATEAVARALPAGLRLGTSSWSFPGWRGLVYDREASERTLAREGLAAYARHPLLRSVGVDRGYYGPVTCEAWAAYAAAVPDGFRFLAKAAELCTAYQPRGAAGPNPRFLDPAFAIDRVVAPFAEGLGARAGPLVFQFPPQDPDACGGAEGFAERLHDFLAALPRGPLYAVEIRNPEWLGPALEAALVATGGVPCLTVHPRMPALAVQARALAGALHGPLVVRWMLGGGLAYEAARARYAPFDRLAAPDPDARAAIADLAGAALHAGHEATVVINNKAEGCAPLSVARLAEAIAARLGAARPSTPARGA